MENIRIGILQYIKSGEISVDTEIVNVEAGRSVHVRVRDFFANSPDCQKLQAQISATQEQWHQAQEYQQKQFYEQKWQDLKQLEISFRTDVLKLASTFTQMELRTERLRKAAKLFDEGRFAEADALLREEDLANDQHNLMVYADYLEDRQEHLWKTLKKYLTDENHNKH